MEENPSLSPRQVSKLENKTPFKLQRPYWYTRTMTSSWSSLWIPGVQSAVHHQRGEKSRKTKRAALLWGALPNLQLVNMYESAPLQLWMTYCFLEMAQSWESQGEHGPASQSASSPNEWFSIFLPPSTYISWISVPWVPFPKMTSTLAVDGHSLCGTECPEASPHCIGRGEGQ